MHLRSILRGGALAVVFLLGAATSSSGCGSDGKDYFVVPRDAGADAEDATSDADPSFDPTLGGPCTEDSQCDDFIACTFDRCDPTLARCRNVPDDAQCADVDYCNGRERCVLRRGCVPGAVETCQDGDNCTIDRCVEATRSCERSPRDSDGDGDPDDHCAAGRDCDDTDPTVSSLRPEICGNFKDDDCDGSIDEQPCVTAANDTCESALPVTAPGTFLLTTAAANKDYATSCTVTTPAAARDIVLAITVPPGAAKDVLVRGASSSVEVAVALQSACGQVASELGCGAVPGVSAARAIARSVVGGDTVYAIVTTQNDAAIDVKVDFRPGTTRPINETCAAPTSVTIDTPFDVSLVDPKRDLPSDCEDGVVGELTYAFSLGEPRDVRIFAQTTDGAGVPVVSMRGAGCSDERRCRVGSTPPVFARRLPAGTHVFSVSGTAQLDASVVVRTYPPTTSPPNQTCATAPTLAANAALVIDLSAQEDAIKNGCFAGAPNAAHALDLATASDVLVLGRFADSDPGAVSLNLPGCAGTADLLACSAGNTPQRVSRRNVAAGSYRVVVADQKGLSAELTALVRPAVPPTPVSSDGCVATQTIPPSGGFFTGDTTTSSADFGAGCDSPGQPIGGANDQLLRLDLAEQRRVVLDMSGSSYTTMLSIRSGAACPGVEIPTTCNPGFGPSRSFVDTVLAAGTHWVQIDGYGGASGAWNLDVRVLPP